MLPQVPQALRFGLLTHLMGTPGKEGPEGSIVVGIILPSPVGCVSNPNLRPGR